MSLGGDQPDEVTSTTKMELPEWAAPYAQELLNRGSNLSDSPYQGYGGKTIADMTPEHEMGLEAITNRAIYGSPIMGAANTNLENTMTGQYMNPDSNPWLANMVADSNEQIAKAYSQGTAAQTDKMFSQGNAMGGSAYQQAVQNNQDTLSRTLAQNTTGIYGQNYMNERANQMNAMGYAPSYAASDYMDMQSLLGVGDVRRGYNQDVLSANYGKWLQQQADPYTKLDVLANSIKGAVGGGGTISSSAVNPYQGSPLAGMVGGGLLGYGLADSFNMSNPWLGAGAGALLGGI